MRDGLDNQLLFVVPLDEYKFGPQSAQTPCIRQRNLIETRTASRRMTNGRLAENRGNHLGLGRTISAISSWTTTAGGAFSDASRAPTFFFLYGYAQTRTVPLHWIWLGVILPCSKLECKMTWVSTEHSFELGTHPQ